MLGALRFMALCIVTGCAFATWATCEPAQTEPSPYKPLQIKQRTDDYRPLVSITRSRP